VAQGVSPRPQGDREATCLPVPARERAAAAGLDGHDKLAGAAHDLAVQLPGLLAVDVDAQLPQGKAGHAAGRAPPEHVRGHCQPADPPARGQRHNIEHAVVRLGVREQRDARLQRADVADD
jgi:hypothetical protein